MDNVLLAGTFAVVCLMIGTAVSEANCDASTSDDSSSDHLNSSASYVNSVSESSVTASLSTVSSDGSDSAVMQCRVGVAVALTFMAGIYQVTCPPLVKVT